MMSSLPSQNSITRQFTLLACFSLLFTCLALGLTVKRSYDAALMAKQTEVRDMTEAAASIVRDFIAKEKLGKLSGGEARRLAAETLSSMRFDNGNYIFVYTFDGVAVVLPRSLEIGTNRIQITDGHGKYHLREMIDIAKSGTPGYASYHTTRIGGGTDVFPKISYVTGLPEWRILIGSGVYIDDIAALVTANAITLAAVFLPLVFGFLVIVFMMRRTITRLLVDAERQSEALEAERREKEDRDRRVMEADRTVVVTLGSALSRLSAGDLTARVEGPYAAQHEPIRSNFNSAVTQLHDTIGVIAKNTLAVRAGSTDIAAASGDLSKRTEQQAIALKETAAAIARITETVAATSESAGLAQTIVDKAMNDAAQGHLVMQGAIGAMSKIERSADEISAIVGVIDTITAQTNLLALNATIEAARAGEAGRGFAVVAAEVRNLSLRSVVAARDIRALINASAAQVGVGVMRVAETGDALTRMRERIVETQNVVTHIASAARRQASRLGEINAVLLAMDGVTQENAAMAGRSEGACHTLAAGLDALAALVDRFETSAGRAPSPIANEKRLGARG